jgi:hypothetical protein
VRYFFIRKIVKNLLQVLLGFDFKSDHKIKKLKLKGLTVTPPWQKN